MKQRLFVSNVDEWQKKIYESKFVSSKISFSEYEDAIILPLIKKENANIATYCGGVCDEKHRFIAGSQKHSTFFCCNEAYDVADENITVVNETVVFGGIFYQHFGVMLFQSLTRLWFLFSEGYKGEKIVFLIESAKAEQASKNCKQILEILGLKDTDFEIVSKPKKYNKVIVPDESFLVRKMVCPEFFNTINTIKTKANSIFSSKAKKIYLSRTKLKKINKKTDCLNEEYYENFYLRRGFQICHLQEYPLAKQISIISNAEEIVSTYGTLANFVSLFIKDGAKQLMLLRTNKPDAWFINEVFLLKKNNIDWTIVEATKNPLKTWHDGGIFLFYPTEQFKEYLISTNKNFTEKELQCETNQNLVKDFYTGWVSMFSKPKMFKKLDSPELFPLLQSLYFQMTGKMLNKKDFL